MTDQNDPRRGAINYEPTFAVVPAPTYAITPQVALNPAQTPPPYTPYPDPNYAYQPRGYIQHQQNQVDQSPTKPGCIVYSCGGICGVTIVVLFIIGIMAAIPWLGLFAIVSLVPGLFILWILYWKNHRNDAYLTRVVKFITIGMLGVIPVAIIELLISAGFFALLSHSGMPTLGKVFFASFISAFLVAALCEESFKLIMAYMITAQPGRDIPNSVLIYSMSGALGLATLENMMYIVQVGMSGSFVLTLFTAVTRALLAVPLHATTGVIIGADVAHNRFSPNPKPWYKVILIPLALHGVYDFCTMFASAYVQANEGGSWIFFLIIFSLASVVVGIWHARKRRQATLALPYNSYSVLSNNNQFAV